MTGIRRVLAVCSAVAALVTCTTAAAADYSDSDVRNSPERTVGCSNHGHSNKGDGYGYSKSDPDLHIRSGPHNNCDIVTTADLNERLNWHCYTVNEQGNRWTYLGVHGDNDYGWVYNENLTNGGANIRC